MHQTVKKACAFLLVLCMFVGILPMGALAAESSTPAQFVGQQLNLGDDLTMHFYVSVDSAYTDSAVMTAAVGGSTVGTYPVAEMTPEEDGTYKFSVDLAVAQMTEEISLTLVAGEETLAQKTYSIKEYAVALLTGSYSSETKALVSQMLNYGAKAQVYFAHNTNDLANAGYELEEAASVPTAETQLSISGSVAGIEYYAASLVFVSKLAVRYYFSAPEGLGETIFLVDGVPYTPESKNGFYYIEVPGIEPQNMDQAMEIIVSDGESDLTISYSPMCYITRMYNKETTSTELKELLQAAYGYHQAAAAYAGLTSYTVSFSDGVAAQTVENGCLATEPKPYKSGYKLLGWYNGDTKFDFSTPITSDISLTAKWEAYDLAVWNDFSDSSSANVWKNNANATVTWLESYEDAEGVLMISRTGGDSTIIGSDSSINWPAAFDQAHYDGAIGLSFRIRIEGDAFNSLTARGTDWTPSGTIFNDQLATDGWQDFVWTVNVHDNYEALNGLFLDCWSGAASTIYIDEITAVWNHTVSFSDGVETQTVQTGNLATEPSVSKDGYKFLGWYNGDTLFDFTAPITEDITLTAKWEEIPFDMWYDFADSSSAAVWSNGATVTHLESYDGAEGVLKISNNGSHYVGATDKENWPAMHSQEHYAGAVGLKLRMKLQAGVYHSLTLYGLGGGAWKPYDSLLGTGEWAEYTVTVDVETNFAKLNGLCMVPWSGATSDIYIDQITVVWNHTVSFSDDVASQTVQTGNLATEPSVSKDGYKFLGWYNGDTLYDFSTPVTSDIALTAKWEEIPEYMWNDFSDSSAASVWTNGPTLTWLESYDGAEGVLKIEKTTANDSYVGGDNSINWPAVFNAEHYADAVSMNFRMKIEGSAFNALTVYGKGGSKSFGKIFNDQLATDGWQNFSLSVSVSEYYDLLNGMFFIVWTNGASTIYVDQITVTFERSHTVTFSDGVEAQTVQSGALATEPTVSKDGYKFLGWYDGDTLYDFSKPVTSDITLTAKWEEIPENMWNDFSDSSAASVWTNGPTLTWLESYDGAEGVLKIEKTTANDSYVGGDNSINWPAVFDAEHYADAVSMNFRVKIEGSAFNALTVYGKGGSKSFGKIFNDQQATDGWQDFSLTVSVSEYYDLLDGMFFIVWTSGASTIYVDQITVTFNTNYTVSFSDGVESQTVSSGGYATEPTVTKDGYRFRGWYDGETLFDFTQPITEDVSLIASWEEIPADMWYDFEDPACATVWKNSSNLTMTHLESYDGEYGVLKLTEAVGNGERYIGSDNGINWAAMFDEAHYGTVTGLKFRVKIEGSAANSLSVWGKGWAWCKKPFDSVYATDGWQEFTIDLTGKSFDTINGMWWIFWSNGPSTIYIDDVTAITAES